MSVLDKLMPVVDSQFRVGSFARSGEGVAIPYILIDYGKEHRPLEAFVRLNSRLTLDIIPAGEQFTFHLSGSLLVVVHTPALQAQIADAPIDLHKLAAREGRAVFAASVTLPRAAHGYFMEALGERSGHWVLITLTENATEFAIGPDGRILHSRSSPREEYEIFLQGKKDEW